VICVCVSESLLLCTYLSYIRLFFDATIIMVNKDFQKLLASTNGGQMCALVLLLLLLLLLLDDDDDDEQRRNFSGSSMS